MKLLIVIFLLQGSVAMATTYYVSPTGNDANPGSKTLPWLTIKKVSTAQATLNPGDSILFERGGIYRGILEIAKSGSSGSHIVYGAYGTGSNPILTGAIELGKISATSSSWTPVGATGIWKCYYKTDSYKLTQLFVEGQRKFISRYPNTGYLFVDEDGSLNSFTDGEIGMSGNYFDGSRIAIRLIADKWSNADVNSVAGSTVTLATDLSDEIPKDCGYYFFGNYKMIDSPGEWYFKDNVDSMYYMPPAGADPNLLKIEASLYSYVINTKLFDYLTFTDLTIERAASDGINIAGSEYSDFNRLVIRHCYNRGIFANNWDAADPKHKTLYCNITNCTITDCQVGILTYRMSYGSIVRNTIKRIGTEFKGYVTNYSDAIVTDLEGHDKLIAYNRIDSTGKNGIRIADSKNIIRYNVISNGGLATADVAGIYLGKSDRKCFENVVRNNFVFDMRADAESWKNLPDSYINLNPGLYNDLYGKDNQWIKNTVYNGGMGILCQNEVNGLYRKNILYDFKRTGLSFVERPDQIGESAGFAKGNKLLGNIFYKKINDNTKIIAFENRAVTSNNWGTFIGESDSNRFIYPYDKQNIGLYPQNSYEWITFTKWKAKLPMDTHSAISFFTATATEPDQSELITNMADNTKSVTLVGTWYDVDGNTVGNSVTIEPWYSIVLIRGEGASIGNTSPSVSITGPEGGQIFASGSSVTISVNAADVDGNIAYVEFFYDGKKIGTDDIAPYSIEWTDMADGQYTLTAIAYDNKGLSSSSSEVVIIIGENQLENAVVSMKAFTPNGDGLNDIWKVEGLNGSIFSSLTIYNDRGQYVQRLDKTENSWDGSVNGKPSPAGAYYYVLHLVDDRVVRGSFLLLR